MQVDRLGALFQMLAIDRSQHCTAPGRQNAGRAKRQLINNGLLDVTKSFFAFPFEKLTDGQTDTLLDNLIGVQEWPTEAPGQLASDGRFSGAGETDKSDVGKGSQ